MKYYTINAWLKELEELHNRSLDYLIMSWTADDKWDKKIYKIKHEEWHEKYVKWLNRYKEL